MAPKSSATPRSATRTTRASSRRQSIKQAAVSAGSPVNGGKGRVVEEEPTPEMPSLHPRHSGLYGVNSYEGKDSVIPLGQKKSRGRLSGYRGPVNEATEDEANPLFKHGQDMRPMRNAPLINDAREEIETFSDHPEGVELGDFSDNEEDPFPPEISRAEEDAKLMPPPRPVELKPDGEETPSSADSTFRKTALPDPYDTPYNSARHPSEPPSSLNAKYGIPFARASSVPISPRSFNQESFIYSDTSVFTPQHVSRAGPQRNSATPNLPPVDEMGGRSDGYSLRSGRNNNISTSQQRSNAEEEASPNALDHVENLQSRMRLEKSAAARAQPEAGDLSQPDTGLSREQIRNLTSLQGRMRRDQFGPAPEQEDSENPPPSSTGLSGDQIQSLNSLQGCMRRDQSGPAPATLQAAGSAFQSAAGLSSEEVQNLNSLQGRMRRGQSLPARSSLPEAHGLSQPSPALSDEQAHNLNSLRSRMQRTGQNGQERTLTNQGVPLTSKPNSGSLSSRLTGQDRRIPKSVSRIDKLRSSSSFAPLWRFSSTVSGFIYDYGPTLLLVAGSIIVICMGLLMAVDKSTAPKVDFGNSTYQPDTGVHWYGWSRISDNLGQFVPSGFRHPFSDFETRRIFKKLDAHDADIVGVRKAIIEIQDDIPDLVYLEKDDKGKPTISPGFWHALRDKVMADDVMLTLRNAQSLSPDISEQHWLAVKRRLESDGSLILPTSRKGDSQPQASDLSESDVSLIVDNKLHNGWHSWLRQNEQAVVNILGPSMSKRIGTPASSKDQKIDIEKALKSDLTKQLVTREEFNKHLTKELENLRGRLSVELRDVETRLNDVHRELSQVQPSPAGMSQREIQALIDASMTSAVTNAKLEAAARAGIKSHLADHLENQINFFGTGAGAVIIPILTSKPWEPPRHKFKSRPWMQKDGYSKQPKAAALRPWHDDGDCYCAAHEPGTSASYIEVGVSREMTPRHLVVEHILPGATLDSGAMPKDVEIWASLPELNMRESFRAWSVDKWPFTDAGKIPENYVKIGQWRYEQERSGDGVQVFKFDDELNKMGLVANTFLVNAITNYGADHTCFYRLRLYGTHEERPLYSAREF